VFGHQRGGYIAVLVCMQYALTSLQTSLLQGERL
jgi:hypothetical protein